MDCGASSLPILFPYLPYRTTRRLRSGHFVQYTVLHSTIKSRLEGAFGRMTIRVIAVVMAALVMSAVTSSSEMHQIPSSNETKVFVPNNGSEEVVIESVGTPYQHFVAHNETMSCSAVSHATPFYNQIRGVNLGGWMVLEPWVTPSLFYQFLGKDERSTAMDMYSFCEVLGPEEGNKQLRRHWEAWLTEDIVEELKNSGAVNSLRLPLGDWMYKPYGPYIGCTDGANEYVDQLLDWAYARGLSVLLDLHALKGSQNGFDNSGQTQGFEWTSVLNTEPAGLVTFEHWPIRTASWMGTFNKYNGTYDDINRDNIQHALDVIEIIVNTYKEHPAVLGMEPVNEPWQYTPIDELKKFYWEGYLIVKKVAPYWKYIMHDSFRFNPWTWGGFMAGCPDRALDTHIYQAWHDPASRLSFYSNACSQKGMIAAMERSFGPIIVGEWSLATDNCAMWLNGFNDNLPGFPRLPCKYIPCSDPYMGFDQPGTPVDPGKPIQGPYGSGMSGPIFGLCPVSRDWLKVASPESGKDWMRAPPEAPKHRDATDIVMTKLAQKKINAFSGIGHGFYFWNFRTDLYLPHWSYILALERGWIPNGNLRDVGITEACHKEDNGMFICVTKSGQLDTSIRDSIKYCMSSSGDYNQSWVDDVHGDDLMKVGDKYFNEFWQEHRIEGATCDFAGMAELQEINKTFADDDWTDDQFTNNNYGISVLLTVGYVILGILAGGIIGFCLAMRLSKSFNRRVSSSTLFQPLRQSRVLRASFAGMGIGFDDTNNHYSEIPNSRSTKHKDAW